MFHRTAFSFIVVSGFASLIAANGFAENGVNGSAAPVRESVSRKAVLNYTSKYHPITQADVAEAKTALIASLERLNERVSRWGQNGNAWKKYVQYEKLLAELGCDKPDTNKLIKILSRYAANHDGLELACFVDVRQALHNYIALRNAVDNPKVKPVFEKIISDLAAASEKHSANPSNETALLISGYSRWLQDARQTPELIQALQQQFARPNFFATISADVVTAGFTDKIDDVMPVRDNILGTDIHGTAHTKGTICGRLLPCTDAAAIEAIFSGSADSENVGYHGPAIIFSNSSTKLSASKRICISADGLIAQPAVSHAETSATINDIRSKNGCRLIERIGWSRAGKQQSQAEQIASSHAEDRLNERIDAQAEETLAKANEQFQDKFKKPLVDRNLFPQLLQFSTTEQTMSVVALQAGRCKTAAPGLPPKPSVSGDITVQLHESAVNNFAFDALAGRTIREEKMQAAAVDLLGKLPDKMKGDEDGKPWAITFAAKQPISISFIDGGFILTLRGAKFYKGDDAYEEMNVTATYKIVKVGDKFKAIRPNDVEALPPSFKEGMQLSGRQQIIRSLLIKRFGKVFEKEMFGEGIELSGKWKSVGKLTPVEVVCRDGWLVLVMRRAADAKVAAK